MNIKNLVKLSFQLLIMMRLLFANTFSVAAQDGDGEDYIGQVSMTVSKSLPSPKKGGIQPLASQPLPGGGTATATARLAWTASRMDGIAHSSLSSNTPGTYSV